MISFYDKARIRSTTDKESQNIFIVTNAKNHIKQKNKYEFFFILQIITV